MHFNINQETRKVIIEPLLTTQAQTSPTDNIREIITITNTDQVGAQLKSIKPIETEEQQASTRSQISQPL